MHEEALAISTEIGLLEADIAEDLEVLAMALGALGQHGRAARLWGAAQALREAADVHWTDLERGFYETQRATDRTQSDEAIWEATFAEWKAMTMEEAIEYALSEEEPDTPAPAPDQPLSEKPVPLTRREGEVAVLVARGLTNRRVASELHISEHTAATHVRKILKKLGLRSRSELAAWVTERRLRATDPR